MIRKSLFCATFFFGHVQPIKTKTNKSRMFSSHSSNSTYQVPRGASQPASSPILSGCHILGLLLEDVERILAANGFLVGSLENHGVFLFPKDLLVMSTAPFPMLYRYIANGVMNPNATDHLNAEMRRERDN